MEIGKIGPTPTPKGYDTTRVHPTIPTTEESPYDPNQDQDRRESTPQHPRRPRPDGTGQILDEDA